MRCIVSIFTIAADLVQSWATTPVPWALRVQFTSWLYFHVRSSTFLYNIP